MINTFGKLAKTVFGTGLRTQKRVRPKAPLGRLKVIRGAARRREQGHAECHFPPAEAWSLPTAAAFKFMPALRAVAISFAVNARALPFATEETT